MDICTIIAKNYLAQARVLADSFLDLHPGGRVSVLVIDDFDGYIDPAEVPFELIDIASIGLDERERMAAAYNVTEFSTAVKPWLLRHLLERGDCDAITYLDPDILVLDDLEEIDRLALEHGLVLNPHFTTPLPRDGLKPSDEDILIAGAYNLGFISLRAGSESERLLEWWSQHLLHDCVIDPQNGYFVDQRWIDLAPGIYPELSILRDPGYNLAYWNLPHRKPASDGGRYTVDGRPLRFFHFSGFDPRKPMKLSRHQNRIEVSSSAVLSELCTHYADAVMAAGYEEARDWPYGWDTLPGGMRLDEHSRRLYRRATGESRLNGSAFTRRGAKRFGAFLTEPDEGAAPGSGVTRYLGEIYRSRDDLREAYPDIAGADAPRFVEWVHANADAIEIPAKLRPNGAAASKPDTGPAPWKTGVNLAGYLSSELGVGEAARQIRSALSADGVDVAELEIPVDERELPNRLGLLRPEQLPYDINLLCVNADMVREFAVAADPAFFAGRYSIGLWFWELGQFPEVWRRAFEPLDEVWVATSHIAGAVQAQSPVPVTTIPLPVSPTAPDRSSRAALGLPEGFCFLYMFDYRSVMRRKNPLGLVEGFGRAFAPDSGASLVIKAVGAERHAEDAALLHAAVAEHGNVHLIDKKVDSATKNAMIAASDCYVSLHRSEGFGLTLAEAMYFGKPVIATGYSGNLDFMTEENSYLVDYEMTRVGEGAAPYPPEAEWAEPDLDHATKLMTEVMGDPDRSASTGRRAAEDIRRTHSPQAAGAVIGARLAEISERPRRAGGPAASDPKPEGENPPALSPKTDSSLGMARLRHLLQFEQAPPKAGGGRIRGAAKRLYLRLLRPYVAYQRRINDSTADALDDVRSELSRRTAATERREREELGRLAERIEALDGTIARGASRSEKLAEAIAQAASRLGEHDEAVAQAAARSEETAAATLALRTTLNDAVAELRQAMTQAGVGVDRLGEEQAEMAATLGASIADFDARATGLEDSLEAAIRQIDPRVARAERLVDAAASTPFTADRHFAPEDHPALGKVMGFSGAKQTAPDDSYRGFEDIFRGSEEMIKDRQRAYVQLVKGFAPVLDIGCGRGEFLDLLAEAKMERMGVDIDPGMVARCREKGHEGVVEKDCNEYLDQLDEGALGAIFSAQVIEHLGFENLERLLRRSIEVLRPGGLFVAETVNPHSPQALKAFWVDPTHEQPLFPETMLALCELAGFESAFVFCPLGGGDYDEDRLSQGEFAIVAHAPERSAKS